MRRRTVVPEHQKTVNHLTVTTCGLSECIDRVVEASGWRDKFRKLPPGRGVGIAASAYLVTLLVVHLIVPRLEPVTLRPAR